jgi:hypothetical protein
MDWIFNTLKNIDYLSRGKVVYVKYIAAFSLATEFDKLSKSGGLEHTLWAISMWRGI